MFTWLMGLRAKLNPERPQRVLGARLEFGEPDGLGSEPPALPPFVLTEFDAGTYAGQFEQPLEFAGRISNSISLRARHIGFPISGVRRKGILAVNASLDTGDRFVVSIRRI